MPCVLRVSGRALDVDALLSGVPLQADRFWRKGEPRSRIAKGPHTDSGAAFLASNADLDALTQQVAEVTAFLESNLAAVSTLANFPGVEQATLDFGVALNVGSVALCSYLPPTLIRLAAQANVGIEVSTYVCNDEHAGVEG
jgi:hypothetical protein